MSILLSAVYITGVNNYFFNRKKRMIIKLHVLNQANICLNRQINLTTITILSISSIYFHIIIFENQL